jgi:hypothetical protein
VAVIFRAQQYKVHLTPHTLSTPTPVFSPTLEVTP